MDFFESIAILGGIFLSVVAIGAVVMVQWRGLPAGSLPLYEMLVRQSPRAATVAVASGSREFAVAVEQCLTCPATVRCRSWLDSGKRQGFEAFCANAGYVTRLSNLTSSSWRTEWT